MGNYSHSCKITFQHRMIIVEFLRLSKQAKIIAAFIYSPLVKEISFLSPLSGPVRWICCITAEKLEALG